MVTEDTVIAINCHYENQNSETRVWMQENDHCGLMFFICYNALSDMDDIYEVTEEKVESLARSLNIPVA